MKKYRKRLASSSEDEQEFMPIKSLPSSKRIVKRGVNSTGELLNNERPSTEKAEGFGGLVLPEDYRKKLEVVGIIKTSVKKQDPLEM
jgi:hypothetical protein